MISFFFATLDFREKSGKREPKKRRKINEMVREVLNYCWNAAEWKTLQNRFFFCYSREINSD